MSSKHWEVVQPGWISRIASETPASSRAEANMSTRTFPAGNFVGICRSEQVVSPPPPPSIFDATNCAGERLSILQGSRKL